MNKMTLTAIVTGFPPGLRPPKPLLGENMLQLVIRNHPQEWNNCLERLRNKFHASEAMCSRLRKGEIVAEVDTAINKEIEKFMNLRLPSHGRTLQGLADIRDQLLETGGLNQLWQLQLSEILWPKQKSSSYGDKRTEDFVASLGVTVHSIDAEKPEPFDLLGSLLKHVHSDYLWILPGGSRLSGPMTIMTLFQVLRGFQENPKLALYSGSHYSMIFRTSTLRELMAAGNTFSPELRDTGRMLQEAGFDLVVDKINDLVEIEPIYGGQNNRINEIRTSKRRPSAVVRTSWWRRLLGIG